MDKMANVSGAKQWEGIASPEMTDAMAAVDALVEYAAVLAKNGGREFLPDLRDMVNEMLWVWAPEDAADSLQAPTELQKEYHRRINAAVKRRPSETVIGAAQTDAIVRGLSIHAEEMNEQGHLLSVWQCCRLAKRLREDFAGQTEQELVLRGKFEVDEGPRFMKFGSTDSDHVTEGRLLQLPALVFNEPVPAEQVPEGWQCYHLSGRNVQESDRMWNFMPRHDYTGSVVAQAGLIRTARNMMRIDGQFVMNREVVSLESFCQRHGFQVENFDRLFPENIMEVSLDTGGPAQNQKPEIAADAGGHGAMNITMQDRRQAKGGKEMAVPVHPGYVFRVGIVHHPDAGPQVDPEKIVYLELPATSDQFLAAEAELGDPGWLGTVFASIESIVPGVDDMMYTTEDLPELNQLAEKLADLTSEELLLYGVILKTEHCRDLQDAGLLADGIRRSDSSESAQVQESGAVIMQEGKKMETAQGGISFG